MPRYSYYVTTDPDAELPPLDTLPSVAATSPGQAVTIMDEQGRLPIDGEDLYLRLVSDDAVYLLPLTPDYELPLGWQPDRAWSRIHTKHRRPYRKLGANLPPLQVQVESRVRPLDRGSVLFSPSRQ